MNLKEVFHPFEHSHLQPIQVSYGDLSKIMMRFMYTALAIIFFSLPLSAKAQQLAGAWKLERYSFEGEAIKGEVNPAQASLFLFTDSHYSISYVLGDAPRSALPDSPTNEQVAAAYRSFVSNSGRYELTDSTLLTYPILTRNPNVTADQVSAVLYTYRIQKDMLYLTLPEAPGDVKVRVEYVLSRID